MKSEPLVINIFDQEMKQKKETGKNTPHWLSPTASQEYLDHVEESLADLPEPKITFTDTSKAKKDDDEEEPGADTAWQSPRFPKK